MHGLNVLVRWHIRHALLVETNPRHGLLCMYTHLLLCFYV